MIKLREYSLFFILKTDINERRLPLYEKARFEQDGEAGQFASVKTSQATNVDRHVSHVVHSPVGSHDLDVVS